MLKPHREHLSRLMAPRPMGVQRDHPPSAELTRNGAARDTSSMRPRGARTWQYDADDLGVSVDLDLPLAQVRPKRPKADGGRASARFGMHHACSGPRQSETSMTRRRRARR